MATEFCLSYHYHTWRHLWHTIKSYDISPTALLPIWKKSCNGIFFALKNPSLSTGLDPANLGSIGKHDNHYTADKYCFEIKLYLSPFKNIIQQKLLMIYDVGFRAKEFHFWVSNCKTLAVSLSNVSSIRRYSVKPNSSAHTMRLWQENF
jgi:hypothetical protein